MGERENLLRSRICEYGGDTTGRGTVAKRREFKRHAGNAVKHAEQWREVVGADGRVAHLILKADAQKEGHWECCSKLLEVLWQGLGAVAEVFCCFLKRPQLDRSSGLAAAAACA